MSCKSFFLFAFIFGLIQTPTLITADPHISRLHISQKSSQFASQTAQNACRGLGSYESECISILQSAPADQNADVKGLTFFTLKFVEDHAANLSAAIKKTMSDPDLYPQLQSAITDCLVQYDPLDDLIETAITSAVEKSYSDASQFIEVAITCTDECDEVLKESYLSEKAEGKDGEAIQFVARDLKENNIFIKSMLSAALNILKGSTNDKAVKEN